jgi:hypothetical protein
MTCTEKDQEDNIKMRKHGLELSNGMIMIQVAPRGGEWTTHYGNML